MFHSDWIPYIFKGGIQLNDPKSWKRHQKWFWRFKSLIYCVSNTNWSTFWSPTNVIWDFLVQDKLFWSKKIMNISVFVFFPSRHPNSFNSCPILMFFISNHTYYSRETISKCLNQSGLPLRGSKTTLKLRYDIIFHRL